MSKKSMTLEPPAETMATPTETAKASPPALPTAKSRVLLVDDHPVVREGLEIRLNAEPDLTVVGLAEDTHQAMELIESTHPDLVITDLSLGGKPGLELVKDLEKAHPNLPVLVLSIHDETLWAERVLRAGAEGYIMKSQATQKVVDAVRQVLGGGIWISDKMNAILLQKMTRTKQPALGSPLEVLTDREIEVYQMIGQGQAVRQIAAKLHLSVKTVEVHREHIKAKLGLRSGMELVRHAVTHVLEGI
jgi:DNA-binding NarL/FixJ family response regulator